MLNMHARCELNLRESRGDLQAATCSAATNLCHCIQGLAVLSCGGLRWMVFFTLYRAISKLDLSKTGQVPEGPDGSFWAGLTGVYSGLIGLPPILALLGHVVPVLVLPFPGIPAEPAC